MNTGYALPRMWYVVCLAASFSLAACSGVEVPRKEAALKACESNLDHSLTLALRNRASSLEAQHLRLWMEVTRVDSKFAGAVDDISVKNVGLKFGGEGSSAILVNPLAGSMAYAAQKYWQKGEVVLPYSPNLIRRVKDLTDPEERHLNAAFGWNITAEPLPSGVVNCHYQTDLGLNPWRNTSLLGLLARVWTGFIQSGLNFTADSVIVNGSVVSAKLVGDTEPADRILLVMMDKKSTIDRWDYYPSIVGNKKTLELSQKYIQEERERLSRRKVDPVNVFWFEATK